MSDQVMYCATCAANTLFQAPPCVDGHDDDCPEMFCTGCGNAIFLAPVVVWSFTRTNGAKVAPLQRRAERRAA